MQAGRQAARAYCSCSSSPGETWCQLLLVSMSACSIYTHPRASPGPITPLSFVSGAVTLRSLLCHAGLAGPACLPDLPALLDIVLEIWSLHPGVSSLTATRQPTKTISHSGGTLGLLYSDPPDQPSTPASRERLHF